MVISRKQTKVNALNWVINAIRSRAQSDDLNRNSYTYEDVQRISDELISQRERLIDEIARQLSSDQKRLITRLLVGATHAVNGIPLLPEGSIRWDDIVEKWCVSYQPKPGASRIACFSSDLHAAVLEALRTRYDI